ncbi:MAG: galactokinase [Acidobacteriota bacterium]|nr:galactokinase [Acidobacteriota bacterium]
MAFSPILSKTAQRACSSFAQRFGREPKWLARAPGRVNLLGAHVDYSDGWVLPGAIDRSVWVAAAPASGDTTTILALDLEDEGGFLDSAGGQARFATVPALPSLLTPEKAHRPPLTWLDYPAGVSWVLTHAGLSAPPLDAVLTGDIPIGAGVSSSAAVEVAFLLAWQAAGEFELERLQMARLARRVENDYLGVGSGIMDQYASLHGRDGHLLLLDCRTLESQPVPVAGGTALLVADSGIRRQLVDSDYNDRPRECAEATALLRHRLPGLRTLRDVGLEDLEQFEAILPEPLARRARHVVEECARVLAGANALRQDDLVTFGNLIRASHESSRDLYDVSIPALDTLAEAAWSAEGCYGARLSGAGFGGCVTAFVDEAAIDGVSTAMDEAFERRFGRRPETFVCRIGDGARLVHL